MQLLFQCARYIANQLSISIGSDLILADIQYLTHIHCIFVTFSELTERTASRATFCQAEPCHLNITKGEDYTTFKM